MELLNRNDKNDTYLLGGSCSQNFCFRSSTKISKLFFTFYDSPISEFTVNINFFFGGDGKYNLRCYLNPNSFLFFKKKLYIYIYEILRFLTQIIVNYRFHVQTQDK